MFLRCKDTLFPTNNKHFVTFFSTNNSYSVALFPTNKWYYVTLFLANLCSKNTLFKQTDQKFSQKNEKKHLQISLQVLFFQCGPIANTTLTFTSVGVAFFYALSGRDGQPTPSVHNPHKSTQISNLLIRNSGILTLSLILKRTRMRQAIADLTLFRNIGRERYFDSTIFLPVISVYFLILLSKLSILSVDRTMNFAIKFE